MHVTSYINKYRYSAIKSTCIDDVQYRCALRYDFATPITLRRRITDPGRLTSVSDTDLYQIYWLKFKLRLPRRRQLHRTIAHMR